MSAIKLAERKLKENDFVFDDLPRDRQDPIWNELLKHPFQLSVQELSALKNARFISLGLFVDSLITINLFILILIFFLLTPRSDNSQLSTPCPSISRVPVNPPGTISTSTLSDVTNSSIVCSVDEATVAEDVPSIPIPNGIFSREQKTLKKEQFQQLLLQKLTHEKLDQFLQHNFPSMFQLKKKYLDKISEEVKKTRSDAVNVCFEEINKEHIPFEPKDVVRLLQDIMEGIQNKRKKSLYLRQRAVPNQN
jgi:hypothetical protein